MAFRRGDKVEVINEEDGLAGSYYAANIISRISGKEYIVQYRTLVNDDGSGPLREILSAVKIRPQPREIVATEFGISELVDAYDNDGWWVGEIIRKKGSKYLVHFENSGETTLYPSRLLRVHQDWKNGVWNY